MIEELHGRRETVLHPATQAFRLYMNIEAENYPAHWHTDLEIIMPTMAVSGFFTPAMAESLMKDLDQADVIL